MELQELNGESRGIKQYQDKGDWVMSEMSEKIRRDFGASDAKRDAGLTTPEDVERFDDIRYGEDPEWQVMDLYRPKAAKGEKLPVIISFHGGGWVYGNKEIYQFYCMSLAQRGFAVVNFTYRLAPEFKFPAPLEDMNLVMAWVLDHAEEYGLDTNRIFGVGDSAGGNGLGLYSAFLTDPDYAKKFAFKAPDGAILRGVALNCGAFIMEEEGAEDINRPSLMADYLPGKGTPEEYELLNVTKHVTADYPPTFLMTSSHDFLKPQAGLMAKALTEANVPFLFRFYSDKETPLWHVFHCDVRNPWGQRCNDDECNFFKSL